MPHHAALPHRIYHLAVRDEWQAALEDGEYRRSTLGVSLEDEGFIHCSFANQVQTIADLFYRGRDDVLLLEIVTSLVPAEVRVDTVDGGEQAFPHIYGPLPVESVIRTSEVPLDADGRLIVQTLDGPEPNH